MFDESFLDDLVDKYTTAVYRPDLPFDDQKQAIISFRQYYQKIPSDNITGNEIIDWLPYNQNVITLHAVVQMLLDNFDDIVIYNLYKDYIQGNDTQLSYSILKNTYRRVEIDPLSILSNTKGMNRNALISAIFSSKNPYIDHLFEYLMQHKLTNEINWAILNLLGWSDGRLIKQVFLTSELNDDAFSFIPNPKITAAFALTLISSNSEYLNWLIDTAWQNSVDGDDALRYLCLLAHSACIPILKQKLDSKIIDLDEEQLESRLSAANSTLALEISQLLAHKIELFQNSVNLDEILCSLRDVLGISTFEYEILHNYEARTIRVSENFPTYINHVIDNIENRYQAFRYYKGRPLEYNNLLDLLKSPHHGYKECGYYQLMAITGKRNLFDLYGDNFNNLTYVNQWEDYIKLENNDKLSGKWKFKGKELAS